MKISEDLGKSNTAQAFWVAAGSLSSFALAIISAAILSRYLDKTEYGTYRQILYIYSSLLLVFSAGLPKVFSYFLPRFSLSEGKHIVKKITLILFLAGVIFSVFLYLMSGIFAQFLDNPELAKGLKVFSPIPALLLPTLGLEGIFSAYRKSVFIAVYNTISRVIMLAFIVIPVLFLENSYLFALYGWIAASVLTLFIALWFKNLPFSNTSQVRSTITFKEIFAYSLPLMLASVWGIAIRAADEFYISRYFGVDTFAEFSNGFMELPFVAIITSSTSVVLMPLFSKIFKENTGTAELIKTWRNAMRKSAIIIYPLVIFCLAYSSEIMILLYSEKYEVSSNYFRIKLLLNFFNIVIFAPIFLANGKTKLYANIHMVLAILVWTTDYALVTLFDSPYAIAINSIVIATIKIFLFIYFSAKMIKAPALSFFPIKVLFNLLLHGGIVIFLVKSFEYFYQFDIIFIRLLTALMLYAIILFASSKLFKIDYMEIIKPFYKKFLAKYIKV